MIHPDKVVTASGQIINRPKSKQQAKKQRQQQQNAQNQAHHSKFSELRKL
jgi:predicted house-cleaning NTP pyrophosphatase (Maf/HAM1 superfamily)